MNHRTKLHYLRGAVVALCVTAPTVALADEDCVVPVDQWQDRNVAMQEVSQRWGLHPQHLRIDDGCYQVRAVDAEGNRLLLLLDPATLEPVELEVRFTPGASSEHYLSSVRTDDSGAGQSGEDQETDN